MDRRAFLSRTAAAAAAAAFHPVAPAQGGPAGMRAFSPRRCGWVGGPRYRDHLLSPSHPESPHRLEVIDTYMQLSGMADTVIPLAAVLDHDTHLLRVHSREHIDSVSGCDPTGPVARMAAGAVLGALQAIHAGEVDNAFCAVRPPGHHAFNNGAHRDGPCMGQGFCFLSNVAIAAQYARSVLGYERVLICDWDYHYGNGTAWAFAADPSVLFFSTHNWHDYPGSGDPGYTGEGEGEGFTINVHLDAGSGDDAIRAAWDDHLLDRADEFKPDLVILSAGFDSRAGDPLGWFEVTDAGFVHLTRQALAIADRHSNGRLLSVLEGGYNPDGQARAVVAHTATLAGRDWSLFELSQVRNRRGLIDKGEPWVQSGVMHVPELARYDMLSLDLFAANGARLGGVSRGEADGGRIDLRSRGFSAGVYYARFKRRSGDALILDFAIR